MFGLAGLDAPQGHRQHYRQRHRHAQASGKLDTLEDVLLQYKDSRQNAETLPTVNERWDTREETP